MKFAAAAAVLLSVMPAPAQRIADPEILLIPSGYSGNVFIVFDIESGEPPRREGNARFYRIPENGILLTQEKRNSGMNVIQHFYFESPSGGREPIRQYWSNTVPDTPENRASLSAEAFPGGSGRFDDMQRGCSYEYDDHFVGTRSEAMRRERARASDALSRALPGISSCPARVRPVTPSAPLDPRRAILEQRLTMVFGHWTRGEPALRLQDFGMVKLLLPADEYALQRALAGGLIEIVGGDGRPNDDPSRPRVFLIFTEPLSQAVRLAIPVDGTTIYVQHGDAFDRFPPNPPLLNEFIDLTPDPSHPEVVRYMADKGRFRSGGSISLPRR